MTIANRLWKRAFGVGVKEPVTALDDPSASVNPALLYHLSAEMVRLKFDLKQFMRLLYNTQTYQREATSYELADNTPYLFPGPSCARMSAEQAWDSCATLVVGPQVDAFKAHRGEAIRQCHEDRHGGGTGCHQDPDRNRRWWDASIWRQRGGTEGRSAEEAAHGPNARFR